MVEGSGDELTLDRGEDPRSRRPRALWGALAALAVLGGTVAVVAVSGGDDELPPALPVALGVGGGAEGARWADSTMAAWVTYVAGEGLPALGGEAPAYELVPAVEEDRVRALADAFGLAEGLERTETGWRAANDSVALEVFDGQGLGGWWYAPIPEGSTGSTSSGSASSGSASGGGSAGCEPGPATDCGFGVESGEAEGCVTYEKDGATVEECTGQGTATATTVPLPERDEAEAIALDLLASMGVDVEGARVTVDDGYDAWYVSVEPLLEGEPVPGLRSTVGVGPEGEIVNATGALYRAEQIGVYPLLDTRAAVDRLNAQGNGAEGGEPMPLPAPETTMLAPDVGTGAPAATTCPPQPDGRELCPAPMPPYQGECPPSAEPGVPAEDVPGEVATTIAPDVAPPSEEPTTSAPDAAPPGAEAPSCAPPPCPPEVDPSATTIPQPGCAVPLPEPEPAPEPGPIEVVLTDAEPVLVLMPAIDGTTSTYLVPGYRLTSDDGHAVDVPAVTDALLAPTPPTEPGQVTEAPAPTEVGGESSEPDLVHLDDGASPEVGVPYYVDVDVECAAFELGGKIWRHTVGDLAGWSLPHEGGRFTLDSETTGTFVGDAAGTKTASFVADIAGDGCTPRPRA